MLDNVKIGDKTIDWQSGVVIDELGEHKLEPLPMAFLKYLVEQHGNVVTKEQLLEAVWHNRQVSDDAIRRVVKLARTALGDDAKSPKYIKTVPLRGYTLVADVTFNICTDDTHSVPVSDARIPNLAALKLPRLAIYALAAVAIFAIALTLFFVKGKSPDNQILSIDKLTTLEGFERQGSYCDSKQHLLFTYQTDKRDFEALYSKDLELQTIHRLNFVDGDIETPLFSPDCSQIAYMVKQGDKRESVIADYNQQGLLNVDTITTLNNKQLLSWSQDGLSLYFSGQGVNSSNNSSAVISRYALDTKTWQQITFSLVEGRGDYFATESTNGQYLAILRNNEGYRSSVLIFDLISNEIKTERHLPFYANRILWLNDDSSKLVIASRKGDFNYFDIESGELKPQTKGQTTLNDVFYHCGDECFYMRQFDMNYSDVKELPNPFNTQVTISTQHLESNAADFNPVYSPDGNTIYFTKKEQNRVQLSRYNQFGQVEPLFSYGPKQAIHNLQIGPNEGYVSGKLGNRVFVFDLTAKAIHYITGEQEQAFYPLFNLDGTSIYFSRLEQGKVVLRNYDLQTQKVTKVAENENIFARLEHKNSGTFVLDNTYSLYQEHDDGQRTFIVYIGDNPYYHWEIAGGYVYFSQARGDNVMLVRVEIEAGQTEQRVLFENSRSYHFNMHPNTQKMLVAESLLPPSDLVKVVWQ